MRMLTLLLLAIFMCVLNAVFFVECAASGLSADTDGLRAFWAILAAGNGYGSVATFKAAYLAIRILRDTNSTNGE